MRTASTLLTLSLQMILVITGLQCVRAQTPAGPTLLTEENSARAIALDSVTRVRDPLPVVALNNFMQGRDPRTRVALFAINLDLMPGENASAVTAQARDSQSRNYSLNVEFVGKVPTLDWLTQVIVRLPDELANAGDVWISIKLHGQTSNEVLFGVKIQSEPRTVTLPARRIGRVELERRLPSPCTSGLSGADDGARRPGNSRSHVRRAYQRHANGPVLFIPR
jgi:hypothetical protein